MEPTNDEVKQFVLRYRKQKANQDDYKLRREMHRGPKVKQRTAKRDRSQQAKRIVSTKKLLNHYSFMIDGRFYSDLEEYF